MTARAIALSTCADTELKLSRSGEVIWQGHAVGNLHAGDTRFKPRVEVKADDILQPMAREEVRQRLQKFADRNIASLLEPLIKLEEADGMEGATRGLAYRLAENFGVLLRDDVAAEVKALGQDDRAKLRSLGVRFGALNLFLPALLKPAATDLRLLLWWLEKQKGMTQQSPPPHAPANGLTSAAVDSAQPEGFYRVCGYHLCISRVVRVDMLERLADLIRDRVFWKPRLPEEQRPVGSVEGGGFTVIPDMMSVVGCSGGDFENILTAMSYRAQKRSVAAPVAVIAEPTETAAIAEPVTDVVAETPVVEAEAVVEQIEISVWWPKDMGPFRVRTPRPEKSQHRSKPAPAEGEKKPRRDKKFSKRPPDRTPPPPKARPEKPMDPNSPFAVLGALRASLTKEKT